jgi:hypothetical protein
MSTSFLRCPQCKCECMDGNIKHEDYLAISLCCNEVCERVWVCETCGDREQHSGDTNCLSCICDAVIADPRELEQCSLKLQGEIAKELAGRLKPFLTRRQAA